MRQVMGTVLGVAVMMGLGVANVTVRAQLFDCSKICGEGGESQRGIRQSFECGDNCRWVQCEEAGCSSGTYPDCNDQCGDWFPCPGGLPV
jgi:hypothetical protein